MTTFDFQEIESTLSHDEFSIFNSAVHSVLDGNIPGELEGERLDFKEDRSIANPGRGNKDKLIDSILETAIGFANVDSGSALIIVGASDKTGGPTAFKGTDIDKSELRTRSSIALTKRCKSRPAKEALTATES